MKKFAVPFMLGVIVTLGCIAVLLSPWWYLFTSPTKNANCLPVDYPESPFHESDGLANDVQAFRPYVFRTETSLETIKEFYDATLPHGINWNDEKEGYWQRSEVRPGEFLYKCIGTPNWEEAETGCIYLRERDGKTVVESIWLVMASSGQPCKWYMSELPE